MARGIAADKSEQYYAAARGRREEGGRGREEEGGVAAMRKNCPMLR